MIVAAFANRADLLTRSNAKKLQDWATPVDQAALPVGTVGTAIAGNTLNLNNTQQSTLNAALLAIDTAINDAHELVLSYDQGLVKTAVLVRLECAIALYYLAGTNVTDELVKQYEASVKTLKEHANRTINLNASNTVNDGNATTASSDVLIEMDSSPSRYTPPADDWGW